MKEASTTRPTPRLRLPRSSAILQSARPPRVGGVTRPSDGRSQHMWISQMESVTDG